MTDAVAEPLAAAIARPLTGEARVPGDKSISHRALMMGGLAIGTTRITGLLEGEDVLATAAALSAYGARVVRDGAAWRVDGMGVGGLAEPDRVLDLGNAGTATRLLMGIAAGHAFVSFMTGDGSLRRRPMGRVIRPLVEMGARFVARTGDRLPLAVVGAGDLLPIDYTLPVASAQVKSAILLAGLHAPGRTTVVEPQPTRDHTERMLRAFGAEVVVEPLASGGRRVTVTGEAELRATEVTVPADPSSAAFPLVAALLVPGSDVTLRSVGMNPDRIGLLTTLAEMGADIAITRLPDQGGEPVADLRVRASRLKAVRVPAARAPSMIDEYPVLAVAAALAEGDTVMEGLAELKVKESDRLAAIARGLAACGVAVAVDGDRLTVTGGAGRAPAGGARIATDLDHRIAMAFLVLGAVTSTPVVVDDGRPIETSFPGFVALMNGLGAAISPCP
jgi:3-phosphoshikimate 1-carboxyvinyltransferase